MSLVAINPYEAPQAEVERSVAFKPRRLTRFLAIAVINLAIAVTSTAVLLPLFFYLAFWNLRDDAVSLPMIYMPVLTVMNTVGLVASAIGLLVNPRWGWLMTVGYCLPGLLSVIVIYFLTWNPWFLIGAPYPAVVLALLMSSTARQAAGLSGARPQARRRRRRARLP